MLLFTLCRLRIPNRQAVPHASELHEIHAVYIEDVLVVAYMEQTP